LVVPEVLFFYRCRGDSRSTISGRGAVHLELYRELIRRHDAAYHRHLFELLWLKESALEPHLADFPKFAQHVEEHLARRVRSMRSSVEAELDGN
jgi:hypothetical protein